MANLYEKSQYAVENAQVRQQQKQFIRVSGAKFAFVYYFLALVLCTEIEKKSYLNIYL